MKALIRFERSKTLKKKTLLLLTLILLLANTYNIFRQYDLFHGNDAAYHTAWYNIYLQVEGDITYDKVNAFKEKAQKLAAGNPDEIDFEVYMETAEADYNVYTQILSEMERVYRYNDSIVRLREDNEALRAAAKDENFYERRVCDKISRVYGDRQIKAYYRTDGFERYMEYALTDFFILFLTLLFVSSVFSDEKEKGVYGLSLSTANGRYKLCLAKITAALTAVFLVFTVFKAAEFFSFLYCFRLAGFGNPIYNIPSFANTPLTVSVGTFLLFRFFCGLLGFFGLALVSLIISALNVKNYISFLFSLAVSVVLMYACGLSSGALDYLNLLNPISAAEITQYTAQFDVVNIFGIPVFRYALVIIGSILFSAAATAVLVKLNDKNTVRRKKHAAADVL